MSIVGPAQMLVCRAGCVFSGDKDGLVTRPVGVRVLHERVEEELRRAFQQPDKSVADNSCRRLNR